MGRLIICGFIINSLVGSVLLWFIVKRTKLCLDFRYVTKLLKVNYVHIIFLTIPCSCTFHALHLITCWMYNSSFPTTFSWWLLNAVCGIIMCVCGEFLCLKTELKEIPVGYSALNDKVDL